MCNRRMLLVVSSMTVRNMLKDSETHRLRVPSQLFSYSHSANGVLRSVDVLCLQINLGRCIWELCLTFVQAPPAKAKMPTQPPHPPKKAFARIALLSSVQVSHCLSASFCGHHPDAGKPYRNRPAKENAFVDDAGKDGIQTLKEVLQMETHLIASSTKFKDGFGCWTHENVSTWPQAPVKAAVKVAKAPKAFSLRGPRTQIIGF